MTKKTKKGEYTKEKNNQPKVEIKELNDEFPETKELVIKKEFDAPLVDVDEAMKAWKTYQDLINSLMKTGDIVEIQGKVKAKKSGINKIAKFFGYTCEIIRAYKEDCVGPQGGKYFVWRVWVKAIAPNGRFRVAGAACASNERKFAHLEHDVYATAETRAKKRAIEELAGMGELELLEENGEENNLQEENNFQNKPEIKEIGVDPNEWIPIRKPNKFSRGFPTNWKMPASYEQLKLIREALKRSGLEESVVFILNNRKDGIPREKTLDQFDKGDAYDVIEAIKKGKKEFLKLIK